MVMTELFHFPKRIKVDCEWLAEAKYFEKLDSTQNRVTQFLGKSVEGPVLVIAETQTKGVGRQGRPWVSPMGGVWFTIAFPMKDLTPVQVAPFSIVAALQCVDALKEVNSLDATLKWPNDILCEGKKLGGVILNTVTKFKRKWLLIGVGINVNNEIPGVKEATSIKKVRGQSQGRSRLIESIVVNLWTAWQEFDRTGFGPYQKSVESKLVGVGKAAKIQVGKKAVKGTMLGVDTDGGLMLKSASETTTVQAGEIVG